MSSLSNPDVRTIRFLTEFKIKGYGRENSVGCGLSSLPALNRETNICPPRFSEAHSQTYIQRKNERKRSRSKWYLFSQRKNYILCVSVMSQVFSIRLLTEGIKFLEVKVSWVCWLVYRLFVLCIMYVCCILSFKILKVTWENICKLWIRSIGSII